MHSESSRCYRGITSSKVLPTVRSGSPPWAQTISASRSVLQSDDWPNNSSVNFRGERLKNETYESRTDPEARLMRRGKGKEAKLVFMGHALMEDRNGLLMDFVVSGATVTAERDAVPELLDYARERGFRPKTLGGDRGYDTRECLKAMREHGVTPHVAQRVHSAIEGRTTEHSGYWVSQKIGKQVEEVFRVDENGRRDSSDAVSGCGAYRAVKILRGCGLRPGTDGEPVVGSDDPGRSVGLICLGRSASKMF